MRVADGVVIAFSLARTSICTTDLVVTAQVGCGPRADKVVLVHELRGPVRDERALRRLRMGGQGENADGHKQQGERTVRLPSSHSPPRF